MSEFIDPADLPKTLRGGLNYAEAVDQKEEFQHLCEGDISLRVKKLSRGEMTLGEDRHGQLYWTTWSMLEVPSIRVPDGEDGGYTIELDWDKIEEYQDTTQKLTESERLENDWVIEAYDMMEDF